MKRISPESKEISLTIRRVCNAIARKAGYGRATSIALSNSDKIYVPFVNEKNSSTYFYTTKSGKMIACPSAYSRKGFSNMVYHHAKCEVVVPSYMAK